MIKKKFKKKKEKRRATDIKRLYTKLNIQGVQI